MVLEGFLAPTRTCSGHSLCSQINASANARPPKLNLVNLQDLKSKNQMLSGDSINGPGGI